MSDGDHREGQSGSTKKAEEEPSGDEFPKRVGKKLEGKGKGEPSPGGT